MQSFSLICLLLTAATIQYAQGFSDKLISISLNKTTNYNGGELGQPLTSYYVKTAIGTPQKTFRLVVDINGKETWVPHYSKMGILYPRLNYQKGYCKRDSSTGDKEAENEYRIDYNSCTLTGKAYKDLFEFKDLVSGYLPKVIQRFFAISSASNSEFSSRGEVDGVLSLFPSYISETKSNSILSTLKEFNLIDNMKFSLVLQDKQNLEKDPDDGGEIIFGGTNEFDSWGRFKYHQSLSYHNWLLELDGIKLGEAYMSCGQDSASDDCTALISTNHNDFYGPPKDVFKILKMLGLVETFDRFNTKKLYTIDCLKAVHAPDLSFYIGGILYTLSPLSYIRKKIVGVLFKYDSCYIGIHANEASPNQWILGTNFLSNYHSLFDVDNHKVAFVPRE